MCGIAGFAGNDREKIERMTRALRHRGPDGDAVEVTEGASLGHARLAILDPRPQGNQPMWNEEKTIAIVYNGEIFNYRELKEKYGLQCKTGTDTEVLLKLFERFGTAFIEELNGMFAFGMYDVRTHTWHVARDASGIKPLFVAYPDGKLHFASEMRCLMHALPAKPALNIPSLSRYLRLQYVPGPETLCDGIEQLPPGTILTWKDGKEERGTFKQKIPTQTFDDAAAFKAGFPAVMDDAVKAHLVSDKPVGIFLSGGMDSSIVLHHMSNHAAKPLRTFTVRFDATEEEGAARFNTDADLARMTAAHYGTEHTEILLTAADYRDLYRETARGLDQPNADSVSVAQYLLSRQAKQYVDVVLSGAGGDELFGGYPRYRIARVLHALRFVPPAVRSAAGGLFGLPRDVLRMSPGADLAERLLARSGEEGRGIVRGDWFDANATTRLFQERFAMLSNNDPVRAFMEFDRHLWLVDESLKLADGVTMAHGLECRIPFLDPRVIAAAQSVPASKHVTLRHTKHLLKEAYRSILPAHLFTLKKASFYPPLAKWLRRECVPLVEESLEHPRIRELFETDRLRQLFDDHRAHRGYHLHSLSSVIQLCSWFETVYDTPDVHA